MSDELLTKLREIKNEKQLHLLPENIKKDVTILGITGTLESGSTINNQDKTIIENGVYTADEDYTGLGNVTVNVPYNSYKFNNLETAEAFQEYKPGDLVVIAGDTEVPFFPRVPYDSRRSGSVTFFSKITVTLSATTNVDIAVTFTSGNKGNSYPMELFIDSSMCRIYYADAAVSYCTMYWTSEDGLSYTYVGRKYSSTSGIAPIEECTNTSTTNSTSMYADMFSVILNNWNDFHYLSDFWYYKQNDSFEELYRYDANLTTSSDGKVNLYLQDLSTLVLEGDSAVDLLPKDTTYDITKYQSIVNDIGNIYGNTSTEQTWYIYDMGDYTYVGYHLDDIVYITDTQKYMAITFTSKYAIIDNSTMTVTGYTLTDDDKVNIIDLIAQSSIGNGASTQEYALIKELPLTSSCITLGIRYDPNTGVYSIATASTKMPSIFTGTWQDENTIKYLSSLNNVWSSSEVCDSLGLVKRNNALLARPEYMLYGASGYTRDGIVTGTYLEENSAEYQANLALTEQILGGE